MQSETKKKMEVIVRRKQKLWGSIACIAFLLGLSAGSLWLSVHFGHGYNPIALLCCAVWTLCCLIPLSEIRKPMTRLIGIENHCLVWLEQNNKTGQTHRQEIPLQLITAVELVRPRVTGEPGALDYPSARLLIATSQGRHYEIPSNFFPGVYHLKITNAIRKQVPGLKVLEKIEGGKAYRVLEAEPRHKTKATGYVWLIGILAVVFSAAMTTFMAQRVLAGWATRHWVRVPGLLQRLTREGTGDSEQVKVLYTYSVGDQTFSSTEQGYRLFNSTEDLQEGQTTTVFYNPAAPAQAVLFRGTGILDIVFVLIPLSVGCAALFVLWAFVHNPDFREQLYRVAMARSQPKA